MTAKPQTNLPDAIDEIDDEIIGLLARRFELSRAIGESKRASGHAPYDAERTYALTTRFMRQSIDCGLSAQMARILIGAIIDQVIAERLNPSLIVSPIKRWKPRG